MHANAVTHRAAEPEQHAAKVAAIAARLNELPKAAAAEERERVLEENRATEAGRIENARAGWKDGGALTLALPLPLPPPLPPTPNPNPNPYPGTTTALTLTVCQG